MGHAVYSVSDPRAQIFKGFVKDLAEEKGLMDDYQLYSNVEQLAVDFNFKAPHNLQRRMRKCRLLQRLCL